MTLSKIAKHQIDVIAQAIADNDETSVSRIDQSISNLFSENDPNTINYLLPLLNDDFDFQEGLWSILHYSESFDPSIYMKNLVASLYKLNNNAPEWAERFVARILNSDLYKELLTTGIVSAKTDDKNSLFDILNRIKKEYAGKFDDDIKIIESKI